MVRHVRYVEDSDVETMMLHLCMWMSGSMYRNILLLRRLLEFIYSACNDVDIQKSAKFILYYNEHI